MALAVSMALPPPRETRPSQPWARYSSRPAAQSRKSGLAWKPENTAWGCSPRALARAGRRLREQTTRGLRTPNFSSTAGSFAREPLPRVSCCTMLSGTPLPNKT